MSGVYRRRPFQRLRSRWIGTAPPTGVVTAELQDEFTFSDSQLREFIGDRLFADSFTFVDSLQDESIFDRLLSDSSTFSDQMVEERILDRLPSDAFTFSDALTRIADMGRDIPDTFVLTENFIREFFGDRADASMQDVFTFSDAQVVDNILTRRSGDLGDANFEEMPTRDVMLDRLMQDTLTFLDNLAVDRELLRLLSDSSTFSDNIDFFRHLLRNLQDSATFSDSIDRDLVLDRLISNIFAFTENLDRTVSDEAAADIDHWRLRLWHKWAERRRLLRLWMSRTYYPPQS